MRLTKYEHASVIIEDEQGSKIIIDPGIFTTLPADLSNIAAIIITHEHPDHFDPENIDKILDASPNAKIFGSIEVADKLDSAETPAKEKLYQIGTFQLAFYGDKHQLIRDRLPIINNLGVSINDLVAYPGDSYIQSDKPAKYLLAPSSAPWLNVKDASEFMVNSNSEIIIPTHDAMLSEIGLKTYDSHFRDEVENANKVYQRLETGQTIDL